MSFFHYILIFLLGLFNMFKIIRLYNVLVVRVISIPHIKVGIKSTYPIINFFQTCHQGFMKVLRVICNLLLCRCNEKKDENKEDVENQPRDEHTLEELIQDDNFNLPISIALLILVIYILVGCFVFPM